MSGDGPLCLHRADRREANFDGDQDRRRCMETPERRGNEEGERRNLKNMTLPRTDPFMTLPRTDPFTTPLSYSTENSEEPREGAEVAKPQDLMRNLRLFAASSMCSILRPPQ
jgi:hypothetical protein